MCLQFDLLNGRNRLRTIPEILHNHIVNHLFTIQPYTHTVTLHTNKHRIPLTKRIICHMRWFAFINLIVVQTA